jgi:AcrR family transcriptional regulator
MAHCWGDAYAAGMDALVTASGAPAGGRRDRKKSETREALRTAAHRLFAEKGFTKTTIDDITEAADVSRRTFFRYYDSKDDLLQTDVADLLPVLLAALRARPASEPPFTAILAALRTLIGPDGPPALAQNLASPAEGIRARLSLIRLLAEWEQGIADTLLVRASAASVAGPGPAGQGPAEDGPSECGPAECGPAEDGSAGDGAAGQERLRAVVTACAATSALRASAQIYRSRYPGRGLDTTRLLPIIEQAFAVLAGNPPGRAFPADG